MMLPAGGCSESAPRVHEAMELTGCRLRATTDGDIPLLALHRRRMFEEIAAARGLGWSAALLASQEEEYVAQLTDTLGSAQVC